MGESVKAWQRELEAGVVRILEALDRSERLQAVATQLSRAAGTLAAEVARASREVVAARTRAVPARPTWQERREQRRLAKKLREEERASVPHAVALALAAFVAGSIAFSQPELFWLFFVAFGLGIGAADTLAKVHRYERRRAEETRPRLASEEAAPRGARVPNQAASPGPGPESAVLSAIAARERRVEAICEGLLSELKSAPLPVRGLLRRPEETVEALRGASRELSRRERELRRLLVEEEGERLRRERADLAARVDAAPDDIVKERLAAALGALDAQLAQRAELATAAARIEAEATRLLYSLESLRAQVLRAVVADAAAADATRASLEGSLETLSAEVRSVATALEEVNGLGDPAGAAGAKARAATVLARPARQL